MAVEPSRSVSCEPPLQEVGVHVIAPAEVLAQNPLKNAVALLSLRDAAQLQQEGQEARPQGAARLAVTVDGTETEAEVAALKVGLLNSEP